MDDDVDGINGCFKFLLYLLIAPFYLAAMIIFGPIILIFKLLDGDE